MDLLHFLYFLYFLYSYIFIFLFGKIADLSLRENCSADFRISVTEIRAQFLHLFLHHGVFSEYSVK